MLHGKDTQAHATKAAQPKHPARSQQQNTIYSPSIIMYFTNTPYAAWKLLPADKFVTFSTATYPLPACHADW